MEDQRNYRKNQQEMDKAACNMKGGQPQQPSNQQDNEQYRKHSI